MTESGDQFVILAIAEPVGVGRHMTTIFGTDGWMKIGDQLITKKKDTIPPVSEQSCDIH